ncbi:hypothetical protein [Aliiroseovarius marinus]|uniref:hypothetical protein n=1 Tax=Aliiroseovarius marinus TaxID=2500159 RepID=UPI003D7DCF1C
MSLLKRFFSALSPDPKEVEAETRKWWVTCKTCGHSKNLWEVGGVRYKATGTKASRGFCSKCGQKRWLKIHKRDEV